MRAVLLRNSLAGILQYVANAALLMVAVPIFIRLLGSETYGVFSLLMIVGNLNSFANLGLTSGLIKYLSEQGKTDESDRDILVAFIVLLFVSSATVVIGLIFRLSIVVHILAVPESLVESASELYTLLLVANVFLIVGQVFVAVLDVQQKIHLTSMLQLAYNVFYWIGVIVALVFGYSLPGVGVATLVVAIGWAISVSTLALRAWGKLENSGIIKDFSRLLRKQLLYGGQVYLGGLLSFCYEPLTKILLARYIGMSEVGYFDIALRIRSQIWGVLNRLFYPLYPMIARIQDPVVLRFIVHDVEQKTLYFVLPLVAICVFTMSPLIELWLHSNVDLISFSAIAILTSFLIGSTVVTPNYHYLLLKGHAAKTIILQLCNVLINTILFLLTYHRLGYYAVVVSTSGAILVSFFVSLHYQSQLLNSRLIESKTQAFNLALLLGCCIGAAYMTDRMVSIKWMKLIATPGVVLCVSIGVFRMLRFFTIQDLDRYLDRNSTLHNLGARVLIRA
jgi:O-antigen/teichoic acid export membrane protein